MATFRGHVGPVYQVAWSADSRLFVSGSKDSTLKVRVFLLAGAREGERAGILVADAFWSGWVKPAKAVSSQTHLSASNHRPITPRKVWDLRTKKLMVDLPGHADEVFTVDWSPDGASVASGGKDKVLKLWRQ